MSLHALIALVILIVIAAAGLLIKRHTRNLLRDMDGVSDDIAVVKEAEKDRMFRSGQNERKEK